MLGNINFQKNFFILSNQATQDTCVVFNRKQEVSSGMLLGTHSSGFGRDVVDVGVMVVVVVGVVVPVMVVSVMDVVVVGVVVPGVGVMVMVVVAVVVVDVCVMVTLGDILIIHSNIEKIISTFI